MIHRIRSLLIPVQVELTSADPTAAIARFSGMNIRIRDLEIVSELTYLFYVHPGQIPLIKRAAAQKGDTVKILHRRDIFGGLSGLCKRPVIVLGILILLFLWFWVPGRIFLVEVRGNENVPTRQILETAEQCGIGFGTKIRNIRNEKMKNALLGALPQLGWAGINTYGSRAVITVREREPESQTMDRQGVSSIVACRDGIVTGITVTRGSALVSPGDAVREGQVLISGYTEQELLLQATRAEGEIMAHTKRQICVKMPLHRKIRLRESPPKTKYSLLIGKNRINLYFGSGICGSTCVKMYYKYVLTLPGGYNLPLAIIRESVSESEISQDEISEERAGALVKEFAEDYLRKQMIAGSILGRKETLRVDSCMMLTGSYDCREMIGRIKAEEIGVYHGKTD